MVPTPGGDAAEVVSVVTAVTSDEVAHERRIESLREYNQGHFETALGMQFDILTYFTSTYGQVHPKCGVAYLDYGTTLLALIQSQDPGAAALRSNAAVDDTSDGANGDGASTGSGGPPTVGDDEDLETCYVNLETARLCFERAETADEAAGVDLMAIHLRQAEVHDSLAQLHIERDDESTALSEFELALALRKEHLPQNDRLIIATMYSMAMCYMREENYDSAEALLKDILVVVEECKGGPGAIDAGLVEEMRQNLVDITDIRHQGGMGRIREEIRQQFVDESSQIKDPEDVLLGNGDGTATKAAPHRGLSAAGSSGGPSSGMFGAVPAEATSEGRLGGNSLMSGVPAPVAGDAEASISHFPAMGGTSDTPLSGPVHNVAVRRKAPRRPSESQSAAVGDTDQPPAKATRTDSS